MNNDAEKVAGAAILKEYGNFFKQQFQDFQLIAGGEKWECNREYQPLQVSMDSHELITVIDLVASDNTLMTKVLGVLSSLCVEVNKLKQDAYESHFQFIATYDDYTNSNIGLQMDAICSLSAFISRCDDVFKNLCSQVFALYTEKVFNLDGVQLHYVINHIGEIFTILVLLELLIINSLISKKWEQFCKDLKMCKQKAENFHMTEEKYQTLLGAIENINSRVMSDNIVSNSLKNLSGLRNKVVDKSCSPLAAELMTYIKNAITNLDKLVVDNPSSINMYKCIKLNALFVLNSHLFGTNDKKTFRLLIELNTKAHSITIAGTATWYPEQFLQRYLPSICATHSKLGQTMLKARQAFIAQKKASLARDIANLQLLATQWILNVEQHFSPKHVRLTAAEMSLQSKLLLTGLDIASQTHYHLLTIINLHVSLGIPLSKSMLMALFDVIYKLKGMQDVVTRNNCNIISSINMIIQHLSFQATSMVMTVRKNLMTDKNYANQRLDEMTYVVIAERALKGAATADRLITTHLALSFIPQNTYTEDMYARLGLLLDKQQALIYFFKSMETFCSCFWVLWHQHVIPIYLEQNFIMQPDSLKLLFFFRILEDCILYLHSTDKMHRSNRSQEFLNMMTDLLTDKVVKSTSQQIETNLRLHIHSHLQLDVTDPFTFEMPKKLLLAVDNFRLVNTYLSVIPSVEHYLSTMYYNLTTVVLSDWKTYGEMRQMAKLKFNLKTVQDNLPTQTLEQGLDVLEIMRNIHVFVSKYHYNLNNQIFIEKSSGNKHLNSINIRHIANSIRTHGTGIMNTTVNFTYQFLKKKFFTFSQFLYDEHIKSRLNKDLRIFRENSQNNKNMYSYKNADKFNKGIRNLGVVEDGQSYLDLFRDLISQIGNAMGYVRMIRSGGRHCCADATIFLPTLDDTKSFKDLCEENHVSQPTLQSAEILDNTIDSLKCNFTQGTEYFKLLVDVFAPIFRNPKNIHLKNFFVIIPPLTLNFVEHMILSKDKLNKKNKIGAAFTDDGFAMGVAYILKLLDQDSSFENLHWFDSVWKHIEEERIHIEDQKSKGSVQLQQTLALTEKKLKIVEEEFLFLYYSLTSARIFFK